MIIAELQYSVVASGIGGGLFPYLYEEVGGWVLSPKQLPQERRSWKDDLYEYRKESIELLFQRIIQALGLKECQVKVEGRNGAFVLASVRLYQVCFLTSYREGKPLFARPKVIAIGHTSILKTLLQANPAILAFCLAN